MTRDELTAILTATRTDAIFLEDGSYLDWSTGELEVGDADGNVVRIPLDQLAIAVLNQTTAR